jgi:hypothetical protein
MRDNKLIRLWTYVTGLVNQERLLQNDRGAGPSKTTGVTVCNFRLANAEVIDFTS